jgi:hypothetical protein
MFMEYEERNEILKSLGFYSYQEYIDSDLWSIIRKEILSRDACFCRICGKRGYEVHHFTYSKDILLGKRPEALITLCRDCHQHLEYDEKIKKPLRQCQRDLLERVTRTKMIKGISNPKIGLWFKNQGQTNRPIAIKIKTKLEKANHVSLPSM